MIIIKTGLNQLSNIMDCGQLRWRVRIKLEAYNLTGYGLVPDAVETISRDVIERELPGVLDASLDKTTSIAVRDQLSVTACAAPSSYSSVGPQPGAVFVL